MTANPCLGQPRDFGGRFGRKTHAEPPGTLADWSDFDDVEAAAWQQQGVANEMARDWKERGFSAFGASDWRRHWFDPDSAAQWRDAGISPADAQHWRRLDFTPVQAQSWLLASFTPDQAASWRADGFPTPPNPNHVSEVAGGDPGFAGLSYRDELDGYHAYAQVPSPSDGDEPDWRS